MGEGSQQIDFEKDKKMDEDIFDYMEELDCEVTVFDGAYMICDRAEEETYEEIEIYKDFDI